jgi:FMN phosphatase YigB (HAD superfamily)
MCHQVALYSGIPVSEIEKIMHAWGDLYERGEVTSQQLFEKVCQMTPQKLDFAKLMHAVSDIFQPNEPAIAIAKEVKSRGHRLFLLSNTCEPHFLFATSQFSFLQQLFDGYVLSYEVKARKPEKKIYEKALEIAGCRNEECFYIDDILPTSSLLDSMQIDAEQFTTPKNLTRQSSC